MGASRMWLDLVGEVAAEHTDEQDIEQRYIKVQEEVNTIWAQQGQHAVLHHLSAIFAYQPLLITY
jgi:predicted nucleic acid-binding Zn ribbon protein